MIIIVTTRKAYEDFSTGTKKSKSGWRWSRFMLRLLLVTGELLDVPRCRMVLDVPQTKCWNLGPPGEQGKWKWNLIGSWSKRPKKEILGDLAPTTIMAAFHTCNRLYSHMCSNELSAKIRIMKYLYLSKSFKNSVLGHGALWIDLCSYWNLQSRYVSTCA